MRNTIFMKKVINYYLSLDESDKEVNKIDENWSLMKKEVVKIENQKDNKLTIRSFKTKIGRLLKKPIILEID